MRHLTFLLLSICLGSALADDPPATARTGCDAFEWDMARELNLLCATPIALSASTRQEPEASDAPLDRRLNLKLAPGNEVQLLAKPGQEPPPGSYAGLLLLKVPRISTYRISTDQRLRIEVVGPDGAVKSSKFTMAHGCDVLHKSVAFRLQPQTAYWVQLSGSAVPNPVLLITLDR